MKENELDPQGLVGRFLTGVYQTTSQFGEELCSGLGNPEYFDVVLELDAAQMVLLSPSSITKWEKKKKLHVISVERTSVSNLQEITHKRISIVEFDDDDELALRLENDVRISTSVCHGTEIHVEKQS